MSGVVDNDHRFNMESKRLQMDLIGSAEEKARTYQCPDLTRAKAFGAARRICYATFKNFEKGLRDIGEKITEEYPEEDYSDLIALLLDGRRNVFFIDLQGRVEALILEEPTDTVESSEAKEAKP